MRLEGRAWYSFKNVGVFLGTITHTQIKKNWDLKLGIMLL